MKNNFYGSLSVILFILYLCGSSPLLSQEVNEQWIKEHYSKQELMIEMRDGIRLFTVVYLPNETNSKYPVLIHRTPYSCRPYGVDHYHPQLWKTYWKEYMKKGYIFVFQDVRGKWMSEGVFEDMVDMPSDTYDTVDWLVRNIPSNNGCVGLFGISYPGFYAMKGALSGHPAIKAVSPLAPPVDWFMGDDFHHNGALMLEDAFGFHTNQGQPRRHPTSVPGKRVEYYRTDNYSFYLCQGTIKNLTRLTGDSIRFWNDMVQHPDYDEWWKARDLRRSCHDVAPAILIVGGLFDTDDCFGAWNLYKTIKKQSPKTDLRLVFGPWFHGSWAQDNFTSLGHIRLNSNTSEYYQKNIELPFFNYHLKEQGNISKIPKITVFFTGSNQWKTFDDWKPGNKNNHSLYLHENGILGFEPPENPSSSTGYLSDPSHPVPYMDGVQKNRVKEYMVNDQRFASRRPDVITFQSNILLEDISLSGEITAEIYAAITTTDIDFVVKVIDVFPDDFSYDGEKYPMGGYQMLVRGDVMRGRYRNSFEHPEAFVPGQKELIRFELPDVAHTFRKGHRIMVQIQSSWFPLVDRNPQQFVNIYQCDEKEFVSSGVTVFHEKDAASRIIFSTLQ
ncbi:MAG: CocE/NonD family hydrolase [Bacteroidales bacterium]|nr:CocE/NonD family hydrolase [Bacteroidales bacterium]